MGKYDDIIGLPHHVSTDHPRMPRADRAAQFSAFKALTGFEDDIAEAARVTDVRAEQTDQELSALNGKFTDIMREEHPCVKVRFFVPDALKDGGRYETFTGTVKRIDMLERIIFFADRTSIKLDDVVDIEETGE